METLHCRFCAELKAPAKLINLDSDPFKDAEIEQKLSIINVSLVSYSKGGILVPKSVCLVCCDDLSKACDFLQRFKKAQEVLSSIYPENFEGNQCHSDDENVACFDDPPPVKDSDEDDQPLSTLESTKKKKSRKKSTEHKEVSANPNDLVKTEPNDEIEPTLDLALNTEGLNVQSLLDAAIGETLDPNTTLYAKEVGKKLKKSAKRWAEYPWLCQHCGMMFPDIEMLRNHSKEQHKRCFAFTCIDCNETIQFSNGNMFEEFLKHVAGHRKSLQNVCPYCDKTHKHNSQHIQTHYPEPSVNCNLCGEILPNEKSLKKHTQAYIDIKPPRKVVKRRGQPLTIGDLTCDVCHKVYKNLNSLRDHKKRHGNGERKRDYTCESCGKTYFTKGSLTSHILMSHKNMKPHECRICSKSFLFPNMLRRHVQMHSGVKPFACEQCGRCFRFKNQLDNHQIVHTDAMPYVCKYCGKAFRFKPILQTHERQHTGARPYSCKDCGLEFTNWSNYNKHMNRRHGMTTAKKKITPNGVFPIDPETGKVIQLDIEGCEEWKNSIMAPVKRGRKKVKVALSQSENQGLIDSKGDQRLIYPKSEDPRSIEDGSWKVNAAMKKINPGEEIV